MSRGKLAKTIDCVEYWNMRMQSLNFRYASMVSRTVSLTHITCTIFSPLTATSAAAATASACQSAKNTVVSSLTDIRCGVHCTVYTLQAVHGIHSQQLLQLYLDRLLIADRKKNLSTIHL